MLIVEVMNEARSRTVDSVHIALAEMPINGITERHRHKINTLLYPVTWKRGNADCGGHERSNK